MNKNLLSVCTCCIRAVSLIVSDRGLRGKSGSITDMKTKLEVNRRHTLCTVSTVSGLLSVMQFQCNAVMLDGWGGFYQPR